MRSSCVNIMLILAFICTFVVPALATGPYHSLEDIFQGQLANLTRTNSRNPYTGGLDGGKCCLWAVNESLQIVDGNVEFVPGQTCLRGDIDTFMSYQFPCTASYNGSQGDQPQVWVSYSWCYNNCPGWTITTTAIRSDWILLLVGFILPTIVFCFSIPRRRQIKIPDSLFPFSGFFEFPRNLTLLYRIPATSTLVLVDTLVWVTACINMAGPMLLSGALETFLDSRLLKFLESAQKDGYLNVQQRTHLLLITLIGNLDLDTTWDASKLFVAPLSDSGGRVSINENDSKGNVDIKGTAISSLPHLPANQPFQNVFGNQIFNSNNATQSHINTTKIRLSSLLKTQPTFSVIIGIGVIFYCSSFFYSLVDLKTSYGDSGTSHALAFGLFWMTIGHVAVVAGMLLASNNPSSWEIITAGMESEMMPKSESKPDGTARRRSSLADHVRAWAGSSIHHRRVALPAAWKSHLFQTSSPSKYKCAWMWNRGNIKALWIAKLLEENPELTRLQTEVLNLGFRGWVIDTTALALILLTLPAFLGGMASYTTPIVGLSCRSMVPTLFLSSEVLLTFLWLCDWKFWRRHPDGTIVNMEDLRKRRTKLNISDLLWYIGFFIAMLGAFISTVGGTIFQLMGLFQNCLCYIPIWQWRHRWSPDAQMYWGGSSSEQIWNAEHYWLPIGISGTLLLIVFAYVCWRQQRQLRRKFITLVDELDVGRYKMGSVEETGSQDTQPGTIFEPGGLTHTKEGVPSSSGREISHIDEEDIATTN